MNKEYIYGVNPVMAAKDNGIKFYAVYVKPGKFEEEVKEFKANGINVQPISEFNYEKAGVNEEINLQGIAALVAEKSLLNIDEIIVRSKKVQDNPVLIIADKITDPHNIGAILRNIAAFNSQGLILAEKNTSPINATVHKTSAGNSYYVDVAKVKSMTNTIKKLKDNGFWIVDTKMNGNMTLEGIANYGAPIVIVLGSEGDGVSQNIQKLADMSLSIEMTGKAESLNVAATSAIILHALQK